MDQISGAEAKVAQELVAAQPVVPSTSQSYGPKKITPKMRQAIRMHMAGKSYADISKDLGYSHKYLLNFFGSAFGRAEKDRLTVAVEANYADRLAAAATGGPEVPSSVFEIKEAETEAIAELRRILSTSKSETARAIAAKEILELSHLKQRMSPLAKPSGDETVAVSEKDIKEFNQAVADLREIALLGSSKPPAPNSESAPEPAVQETPEGVATSEADAPAVSDDKDGSQK